MKKIIFLLLLITGITTAQEFTTENKTITGVFEVKDKSKSDIFGSINKWIAINYNSSKNVIQMSDLESGTIIVKGKDNVKFNNPLKEILHQSDKSYPDFSAVYYNYSMEINIKDNKFRIIYNITDISDVYIDTFLKIYNVIPSKLVLNCLSFSELDSNYIAEYNINLENYFKGKSEKKTKEREQIVSSTKPMFEESTTNLILNAKEIMFLIQKSVIGDDSKW